VHGQAHRIPIDQAHYWKHNGVVWAGPREIPAPLKALVEALHFELYRAEYILERRAYAAHVTLLRTQKSPGELPPLPEVDWPAEEFTLVSSNNSAKGPVYEVLEHFAVR
jgi:RNA 2',3'-cyclic 3'-phosphodiesterase